LERLLFGIFRDFVRIRRAKSDPTENERSVEFSISRFWWEKRSLRSGCQSVTSLRLQEFPNPDRKSSFVSRGVRNSRSCIFLAVQRSTEE